MRLLIIVALICLAPGIVNAQGRIVLNGGRVSITNGGVVVIANGAANAITRTSGYFLSEGQNNRIKWNIGTTAGARTIPWGTSAGTYIPVTFTPSAATGATGYFYFATYSTAAQNSLALPTGITNFNSAIGVDASLTAVDRFWRIEPLSYTVRPTLSNLVFNYTDPEYAAPNKTTVENKLTARRWNSTSSTWQDYVTNGVVNTAANTITIASLPAAQLFPWWSVQYPGASYHWIASTPANFNTSANWSATVAGTGGAGVPSAGDAVFFDDPRDGNCTVNAAMDVGSVTVATGYSGIISQGTNAITVEGDANFSSGTFSGGSVAMTVNGSMLISGAVFTATTGVMDIKRNFTVSGAGTFAHNNGTLRFSGTTGAQIINAPSVTFRSIDVTNSSASPGLVMESNNLLTGILSLGTNVMMDPDGASNNRILTLASSADNPTTDAAVGILPSGASVNGRVTVQRFMTIEGAGGGRIYRYIGSPLTNATVADIQAEIPVTGTFTGTSVCAGCATAQSMFAYDESVLTDINGSGTANFDDGYVDFPQNSNTEMLTPGRGYALFVRGNTMTSARWDVRGNINTGNTTAFAFPVSFTSSGVAANDGWNLVANPFPSTINWNAASGWTKTNVGNSIYTRDNAIAGGQFATWNGVVGTNGGTRYIALGQAFWVKANATPVLTANENVKAAGTQTIFFREESPQNLVRITLHQGNNRDEAVVHFRLDATNDLDAHADAEKLPNAGFGLSTQLTGKEKLAINSLDQASCETSVNLVMDNVAKGNYTLSFAEISTFAPSTIFTMKDAFTGTSVNVREADTYSFSVTASPASYTDRFSLTIVQQPAPMDYSVTPMAVCDGVDTSIQIDHTSSQNLYEIFVNDSLFISDEGKEGNMSYDVLSSALHTGNNAVTVRATPLSGCGSVVEKKSALVVDPIVAPQSVVGGSVCREGQITLSATGAMDGQQYNWYASEGDITPLASGGAVYTTPPVNKSRTYLVGIVNKLGCEGERIAVNAEVVQYDDPVITFRNDSLFTEYSGPKQWYVDGELLEGDTLSFITPKRTSVYSVTIPVQQCVAIASFTYTLPDITTGTTPEAASLQLFPNPVTQYLYFYQENSTVKEITVQNISGQFIGTFPLTRKGNVTSGRFNMSGLAQGVYVVRLRDGNGSKDVKVVRE